MKTANGSYLVDSNGKFIVAALTVSHLPTRGEIKNKMSMRPHKFVYKPSSTSSKKFGAARKGSWRDRLK